MTKPILALTGASSAVIQALLLSSARRWRAAGLRVAGAVEVPSTDGSGHHLIDLITGARHEIYQPLGSGSQACRLCASGIAEACEEIRRQICVGCDVAVLSKFGKLEAGRGGLVTAFATAVSDGVPVLTAVAPNFAGAWKAFSGCLSAFAAPDAETIEAWRLALVATGTGGPTTDSGRPEAQRPW